jgi:hypothetical protein
VISIENLEGSSIADTFVGDDGSNRLLGGRGHDHLSGLGEDDVLDGARGSDTGDGGDHDLGDVCVSIESATDCESTTLSGSAIRWLRAR